MATVLIATNILVYAHDPSDPEKAVRAIEVLDYLQSTLLGRLSVQSLAEFFVVATRGKAPLLAQKVASRQLELLSRAFRVLDLTPMIVIEASRGVREYRFSYWDAQIWATARLNQIPLIFSEDFQQGASFEGVSFTNPFSGSEPISELV